MSSDKATVLVVDDTPDNLTLINNLLRDLYRVKLANGGERALKVVHSDPRPDLILLDIMMPRRSGFEVCRLLKDDRRYHDIPIIMVTALHELGDMERARECGADDYISKPVNKIELVNRVQNLLRIRHQKRGEG